MNSCDLETMSLFLKKTTEFSKNKTSIEDFAAYVLSNFQLKANCIEKPVFKMSEEERAYKIQKEILKILPSSEETIRLKNLKDTVKRHVESIQAANQIDFDEMLKESSNINEFEIAVVDNVPEVVLEVLDRGNDKDLVFLTRMKDQLKRSQEKFSSNMGSFRKTEVEGQ